MKIFKCLATMAAFGLVVTGPALAQEARGAGSEELLIVVRGEPPQEDVGRAERITLSTRLIELSVGPNFGKTMETMIADELGKLDADGEHREEAAWMRTHAPRLLSSMAEEMLGDLAPLYADTFTAEELQAQIAFYETPVGRQIAAKSVHLGAAAQEVANQHLMAFVTELMTKYCAEFDCEDVGGQTGAKPSRF